MLKLTGHFFLFALCITVSGCFPYHYTMRPGLAGTVVSTENNAPLANAGVWFDGTNASLVAFSAADGSFYVPPRRKWGVWIIPQDVFPMRWSVRIYHPGYQTTHAQFLFRAAATGPAATQNLGTIPLKPTSQ
jgi:hypothetical protein